MMDNKRWKIIFSRSFGDRVGHYVYTFNYFKDAGIQC